MLPKKSSLETLSNQALCKLRDEVAQLLNSRAENLQREINQLTGGASATDSTRRNGTIRKVPPKYRGPNGEMWSGRGLKPRWLTAALKGGKELQDFLIDVPKKKTYPKNIRELRHHVSSPELCGNLGDDD
jgi:DNA-binding protein H-NS